MPKATIHGIATRYEVFGEGPPLLMYAPGGFDATIEKWRAAGVYERIKLLEHLPQKYRCIAFDRRECGQSGGRVEQITWRDYADQGKALLEHLGIRRAHLIGGCMGCSCVMAFAVAYPEATQSMILWWPVGGVKYRIKSRARFTDHVAFVREHGLQAAAALVQREGKAFNADARGGPWASPIRSDAAFAASFPAINRGVYTSIVKGMRDALFDRDTSPGASPEDLFKLDIPALVVPGRDESHATSAARYLEECLPEAEYWDAPPEAQTEQSALPRLLQFLEKTTKGNTH
ncbi:MAG TPA: alpha/beta hydrolase [Burkholderiales bacterium]|nr:alpha/beta hydrolase [Burkholderiales bacterium]